MKKAKSKVPISREKVKILVKRYLNPNTETELCKLLDISLQQYLNLFRDDSWDKKSAYALCFVLMAVTKRTINPQSLCDGEQDVKKQE